MSEHLILIEKKRFWKSHFPDFTVLTAREYLSDPAWAERKDLRIVNLCRTRRYLGVGYYCSLLAEARGHKVIPSIRTIQDLRRKSLYSLDTSDLGERVEQVMRRREIPQGGNFVLNIMFGECAMADMQPFARELFELFRAPLLTVEFSYTHEWRIKAIKNIALQHIKKGQQDAFFSALERYLSRRWHRPRKRRGPRFDLAVLHDPQEDSPPSNQQALQAFVHAARKLDINAELVTQRDYGRLAEYDALFIRATTAIDHYTYRFARKAAREGIVVIDDPDSILRCTNKIYLAELLRAHGIATPKTLIIRSGSLDELERTIPYPVVLKVPDGSFSRGVYRVENRNALERISRKLFKESELLLAQEFTYTEFDWRVGILNRKPIYVCQYFMSTDHWQIINHGKSGEEGDANTLPVIEAPKAVVKTALKAANLIGDGLYGVDLKQTATGVLVIEVNDNPSIDAGVEDAVQGAELYRIIMQEFLRRMEVKHLGNRPPIA